MSARRSWWQKHYNHVQPSRRKLMTIRTLKFALRYDPANSRAIGYHATQQNAAYNHAVDVLNREPELPKRSGRNHPDALNKRITAWRQANRQKADAPYYIHQQGAEEAWEANQRMRETREERLERISQAIAAVFAGASWQRCLTHFMANLLTRVPKRAQPGVATMVRTIYQQLSPAEVHGQLDRVVEQLREPFPQVAELLADAAPDLLACTAFPVAHWQKLWSNNPQERLNREIRRRRACPRKGTWWASSPTGRRHGA